MNLLLLRDSLKQFFFEDIGNGDITSEAIFSADQRGIGQFLAKDDGVFCGAWVIKEGFRLLDSTIQCTFYHKEGTEVKKGDIIAEIEGSILSLLSAERVILNLVQRMSAIATQTRKAIYRLNSTHTKICDTRKTLPGLRLFDKYAVKCGGGYNHRFGLFDTILIKDNHIAAAGGISNAVAKVRQVIGHTIKVEVETETEDDVLEAIKAGADIIMFDNQTPEQLKQLVQLVPSKITTEASGGITMDNIHLYRHSNVDYISLGLLTHSVSVLDISFNVEGVQNTFRDKFIYSNKEGM